MATFTNQATLSYNGNVTTSNIVTGEITEILTVNKTSLSDCYFRNSETTYIITLINSGTTAINGLTVTDNLGAYDFGTTTLMPLSYIDGSATLFVNGVEQPAPTVTVTNDLVFTDVSVPPSSNAMIIYRATTDEYALLGIGSTITNTVTVTGDGLITPVSATETITACDNPRLEITKALSPSTVTDNGQLTYTITLLNFGNTEAVATDNIIVTDTFNPVLNPITVTLNGVALTSPTDYNYNVATGEFSTVAGRITVPAATYTQDPVSGVVSVTPGTSILTITGTV